MGRKRQAISGDAADSFSPINTQNRIDSGNHQLQPPRATPRHNPTQTHAKLHRQAMRPPAFHDDALPDCLVRGRAGGDKVIGAMPEAALRCARHYLPLLSIICPAGPLDAPGQTNSLQLSPPDRSNGAVPGPDSIQPPSDRPTEYRREATGPHGIYDGPSITNTLGSCSGEDASGRNRRKGGVDSTRPHHHHQTIAMPRSRSGCLNCKRRKRKCDEQRPGCQACTRRGIQCEGYATPLRWAGGIAVRGRFAGVSIPDVAACANKTPAAVAASSVSQSQSLSSSHSLSSPHSFSSSYPLPNSFSHQRLDSSADAASTSSPSSAAWGSISSPSDLSSPSSEGLGMERELFTKCRPALPCEMPL